MKLAYIGFDKTSLKTNTVLGQHFSEIDNYLLNPAREAINLNFFSLPIVAGNVCIPIDESLYTVQHKSELFKIKNEYTFLKKNIFSDFKLTGDEITGNKKTAKHQFDFTETENIQFDKKQKKYIFYAKTGTATEYDYLVVQGHQLVTDRIQSIKQNVLAQPQTQSYLALNMEFSVQYKIQDQHLRHDFIYIDNTNFKTIFDNWYICSYSGTTLFVSIIVPAVNYKSEDLMEFMVNRTRMVLGESLTSFDIGPLLNRWISCVDGFVLQKIKLNFPKYSAVFPSFDYWTQNKINNYIKNIFILKNKKNQILKMEKEI